MAALSELSGKLVFKMNTGEVRDGRTVYRGLSIGGVKSSSPADDLAAILDVVEDLVQFPVEQTSLTRVDLLSR
ncbi:MAG: hypothetical protein LBS75_08440 [Synergistaceae bacterium]|jgi:hypothetical protein|nr:hypothetical protein [Synergistaceae bacterium]